MASATYTDGGTRRTTKKRGAQPPALSRLLRGVAPPLLVHGASLLWVGSFLRWTKFAIDGDEGIVGVMASHILRGSDFPYWFYGQQYMGSTEAWVAAPFVWCFGTTQLAIKLGALVFWFTALECSRRLYIRMFPRGRTALLASLYLACGPLFLTLWSTKLRGGYVSIWALGALTLLLAANEVSRPASAIRSIAFGLAAGLALYTNLLAVGFVGAAVWYLAASRELFRWRASLLRLLGLAIGLLSFVVYNVQHPLATFASQQMLVQSFDELMSNLYMLCAHEAGVLLGTARPWSVPPHTFASNPFWIALQAWLVVGLVFAAYRFRWLWRSALGFRRSRNAVAGMLVALVAITLPLVAIRGRGIDFEPRFLSVLYLAIAPIMAGPLDALLRCGRASRIAAGVLAAALITVHAVSIYEPLPADLPQPCHFARAGIRAPLDGERFVHALEARGVDAAIGDYWLASTVAYLSDEHIAVDSFRLAWLHPRLSMAERVAILRSPSLADVLREGSPPYGGHEWTDRLVVEEGSFALASRRVRQGSVEAYGSRLARSSQAFDGDLQTIAYAGAPRRGSSQELLVPVDPAHPPTRMLVAFDETKPPPPMAVVVTQISAAPHRIVSSAPPSVWFVPLPHEPLRSIRIASVTAGSSPWGVREVILSESP